MSKFAGRLIKVWDLERSQPITKEFLTKVCSYGYGKNVNNYFIFNVNMPNFNDGTLESKAFNTCKVALQQENKYKREEKERYEHMMFTY